MNYKLTFFNKNIQMNNVFISSKNEMTKTDLIETILLIINKILDYTSSLDQITPTLFDKNQTKKKLSQENENEGDYNGSTTQSSSDEAKDIKNQDDENEEENEYTLTDYFYFWTKKMDFSENLLILAFMNIDLLLAKEFILTENNVKNVLFTSMMLTQKYYEDENYNDKDYSKIIGINCNELIKMEIEFLSLIDFSLHITDEQFTKYKCNIQDMWRKTLSMFSFT